jgi:putative FmdB family regulatory protein
VPIYEYQCNRCRQITEALQKFSDPTLTECPHCHGRLKKLMSLNSFHLKGSGWYVTDYTGKKSGGQQSKSSSQETAKEEKTDKPTKIESSTNGSSDSKKVDAAAG